MKVAFVQDIIQFAVPLGTATIAGSLRKEGHKVDIFVVNNDIEKTLIELETFTPDAVAFSVITGSHLEYIEIAKKIKKELNIPIIWGGPHATFFPKIIEEPYADAICIGEGEYAILDFAKEFDKLGKKIPIDVPNFWVKVDGKIYRKPVRSRIHNLDDVPYPARDIFFNKFPIMKNHGIKSFTAHRGCPHKCTYCFNHSYNKMYKEQAGDKKVFFSRTPESIVKEIKWLQKSVVIKTVAFVDDVFTIHKKWTMDFAKVYREKCGIPFSINARFDHMDEEIVSALSKAGLSLVHCGIESGNDYMRNTVMLREQSLDSIYKTSKLLKKYKVKLLTENVLGNPGETFDMAMETLKINIDIKPDISNASIFAPYPGLQMTQYAINKGYFDGNFDSLQSTYWDSSVLKFESKADEKKIYNLRCFFSLLTQHPWLMFCIKPLLHLPFKKFFWTIGNVLDGYYTKKGMSYKLSPKEFIKLTMHFLKNYRNSRNLSKDRRNSTNSYEQNSA